MKLIQVNFVLLTTLSCNKTEKLEDTSSRKNAHTQTQQKQSVTTVTEPLEESNGKIQGVYGGCGYNHTPEQTTITLYKPRLRELSQINSTLVIRATIGLYSALLRAFLKAGKMWPGLGNFLTWWQLSNLRPEDYLPGLTNEGKKMMSTVEQAYIAYAKQVLLHPDPAAVRALIDQLETLHEQHPEYQYPPYYQAKLLVASGSKDEAMTALLPFARRKQSEFWLWDLLAELYDDEPEKAIACLCRAVSCTTQEKFLVNARLSLAVKLNEAGKFNEAMTELTKSVKARQDEGWNVVASYSGAVEKLVGKGAVILNDNRALYRQYRPIADGLSYADIPEQIGVVTFINVDKKVAHFNVSRTVSGHFKYEGSMARVQPGDFVAVRLKERVGKEGSYWVPLFVKPTSHAPSNEVFRTFTEPVRRADRKEFGFVNDVFIPPNLLKEAENASTLIGSALWSFDKLKNKHGWKAITVGKTKIIDS